MRWLIFLLLFPFVSWASEISVDGDKLVFTGDIDVHDEETVAQLLMDHSIRDFDIESRGGDVYSAMQIGRLVRKYKLNTIASGPCLSACTIIFIRGKERRLEDDGEIGFHRAVNLETGQAVDVDDGLYNRITIYAWGSGVDPIRFVQWMTYADPSGIYIPSEDELCSANILKPCR